MLLSSSDCAGAPFWRTLLLEVLYEEEEEEEEEEAPSSSVVGTVSASFFAQVETPCVQRLRRSSYASEVRVTIQVEVQKQQSKTNNQTKQTHQNTPTQKRPQQKTATWCVAQAAVSAK